MDKILTWNYAKICEVCNFRSDFEFLFSQIRAIPTIPLSTMILSLEENKEGIEQRLHYSR